MPKGWAVGVGAAFLALASAGSAAGYIEILYPLQNFLNVSIVVAEGTIETADAAKKICVVKVGRSLKGKCHYERLRISLSAARDWHGEAAMKHLVAGAPALVFYNQERRGQLYVNRFFCQISGDPDAPPDRDWWQYSHIEIRCNRTYNGTVEELRALVADVLAGRRKAPAPVAGLPPITKAHVLALPPPGEPVDESLLPPSFAKVPPRPRDPENPANGAAGIAFECFEGTWDRLPDFSRLKPVKSGIAERIDAAQRSRDERFGMRFTGFIAVPRDGTYAFWTTSDDGSKLFVGSEEVVSNDGVHAAVEVAGEIALKAGKHAITILYFNGAGAPVLDAAWRGPGMEKRPIPSSALHHAPSK